MKIVVEGKLYDTTKTPILVVLDTADIQSVRELTRGPLEKPLNFFECPEALSDTEMDALCEEGKERVRKYEKDQFLQGKYPCKVTIPQTGSNAFYKEIYKESFRTGGMKIVDMQRVEHGQEFYLHLDAETLADDLAKTVREYGGVLEREKMSIRPIMRDDGSISDPPQHLLPSGTVVEFRKLDQREWLDEKLGGAVESFRKSDAMASFLDEILLQGMTCEHCGHKGLERPPKDCICHETVVGKDECPVHGKPAQASIGDHVPRLRIITLHLDRWVKTAPELELDWSWFNKRVGKLVLVQDKEHRTHEATINRVDAIDAATLEIEMTVPVEMALDEECPKKGVRWAAEKGDKDGSDTEGEQTA